MRFDGSGRRHHRGRLRDRPRHGEALRRRGRPASSSPTCSRRGRSRPSTEIEAGGGRALALRADVTVAGDVDRMVIAAEQGFGPVDVLVNNAYSCDGDNVALMDEETWDRDLRGVVTSAFLCSKRVLRSDDRAARRRDRQHRLRERPRLRRQRGLLRRQGGDDQPDAVDRRPLRALRRPLRGRSLRGRSPPRPGRSGSSGSRTSSTGS